ncbi:MAG: transglutaminaseTgpA domain-containing protein [Bacillota bacterium]|nr:transglutaminaseTgpA domain-containing protein [Bacillota bacterium]
MYSVIFFSKFTFRLTVIILAALILCGLLYTYLNHLMDKISLGWDKFLFWFTHFISGPFAYNRTYSIYVLVALCAAVTLFVYFFTFKKFNFYVIMALGAAIFASQWIYNIFESITAFYIFAFLVFVYYLRHVYIKNSSKLKVVNASQTMFTVCSAVICAFILLTSMLIPAKQTPMSWNWLDDKVNAAASYVTRLYNFYIAPGGFSISGSGFGGANSLGGRVRPDKTLVMEVDSPKRVYLRGASWDDYTGINWVNTGDKSPVQDLNRLQTDNEDMRMNIPNYQYIQQDSDSNIMMVTVGLDNAIYHNKISVTFENVKTKTIFAPLNAENINLLNNKQIKVQMDTNASLLSNTALGKNFKYTVDAFIPSNDDMNFINTLRRSTIGYYYNSYQGSGVRYSGRNGINIIPNRSMTHYTISIPSNTANSNRNVQRLKTTFEDLNEIYAKYLQLPVKLPDRVMQLAESITSKAKTNYDKVKAIESYLSKNYPYTLSPKPTPHGKDFVDYFLFEGKEGYCTYYATSMAVLVRCLGIPARYVEGYITPSSPSKGTTYKITNEQAHAWVEVYFEGYGWVSFEPTAPFTSAFYNRKTPTGTVSSNFADDSSYTDYMKSLEQFNIKQETPKPQSVPTAAVTPSLKSTVKIPFYIIIIISAAMIFIIVILYNNKRRSIKQTRWINLKPDKSILMLYKYYVNIFSVQGMPVLAGETPQQYSERIDASYNFPDEYSFRKVSNIFSVSRYSRSEASVSDRQYVAEFYSHLMEETRKKTGSFRFLIYKYLLGRF